MLRVIKASAGQDVNKRSDMMSPDAKKLYRKYLNTLRELFDIIDRPEFNEDLFNDPGLYDIIEQEVIFASHQLEKYGIE